MEAEALACRVSTDEVKERLNGKEGEPVNWNGNVWEGHDEAVCIEPVNSDESYMPVDDISPSSVELVFPPPVVASPLTVVWPFHLCLRLLTLHCQSKW